MSASREKKKRQELYDSGEMIRDAKKTPQRGLSKLANWLIGIGAIIFAIVFVCLVVFNSNVFLNNIPAASVGDTSISAGAANYYYWDAVNTTANYYGDYFQYFVDTSKSYKSQAYSEDMSWADYFMQTALTNMQQQIVLSDAANANNITLTAEQEQSIDDAMASLENTATQYGLRNAEAYLKTVYGKASSLESYRAYVHQQMVASNYYSHLIESYDFSKDDIDNYYAEHKNDFDTVSYRVMTVTADENTVDPKTEAERIAEASANREAIFLEEAGNRGVSLDGTEYDAETATLCENYGYSNVSGTPYADWLFDETRLSGDTYVAEYNSGTSTVYYVLYFLERNTQDYQLVNVRHILISATDSSDADAMAAAKTEAELVLSEWEAGDATEESFAALANTHSTDPGSNTTGGLYENVYQGQMVDAFNDWCFDESRQVGDTGIVETSYGYHVMYFSGYSTEYDSYLDYTVDSTLRTNAFNDWYAAQQESYPVDEKGFGSMFVNK